MYFISSPYWGGVNHNTLCRFMWWFFFLKGTNMFLLCFTFPRSHNLSMTFSSLPLYRPLLSYGPISDCKPGKKIFNITGSQDRTPCEYFCRIALSCTTQHWAHQKVTPGVMVNALLVSIQHFPWLHGAFHTSVWFCWKTVIFDLSQLCLSMVCIFRCSGSKPLTFFSFFWRGLLTCLLSSISVSFSVVFRLHWEEHAVHVHSLLPMFVLPGKDQFSLTASCHTL